LYETDDIKIIGAFLQWAETDRQVIIRKCLYEADAIKIVEAFLQCSQTDLQVIIRKCLHEADAIKIVGARNAPTIFIASASYKHLLIIRLSVAASFFINSS
jgi:hypothetical protein